MTNSNAIMNGDKIKMIKKCEIHNCEYEAKQIFGDIYTSCPKCQDERRVQREKEEKDKELARIASEMEYDNRMLAWLGVSKRFIRDYRKGLIIHSEILNVETSESVKLHEVLQADNDEGLVMLGAAGIGKSYAVYKFITESYFKKKQFKCFKIGELENIYKNDNFKAGNFVSVENKIQDFDGVIIDELDDLSKDGCEIINKLICYCYDNLKKVILIGNCDMKTFKELLDDKTRSRIKNFHFLSNFKLKDLRG